MFSASGINAIRGGGLGIELSEGNMDVDMDGELRAGLEGCLERSVIRRVCGGEASGLYLTQV